MKLRHLADGRGLLLIAIAFAFALIPIAAFAAGAFWDDDGNPHEPMIEAIAAEGITNGCGTGQYCPDRAVTRAEMATFIARAFDLPDAGPAGFVDTGGSVHAADIDKLASSGVTTGCEADRFCPDLSLIHI